MDNDHWEQIKVKLHKILHFIPLYQKRLSRRNAKSRDRKNLEKKTFVTFVANILFISLPLMIQWLQFLLLEHTHTHSLSPSLSLSPSISRIHTPPTYEEKVSICNFLTYSLSLSTYTHTNMRIPLSPSHLHDCRKNGFLWQQFFFAHEYHFSVFCSEQWWRFLPRTIIRFLFTPKGQLVA